MKHDELLEQLTVELRHAGIPIDELAAEMCVRHLEWLLETNKTLNLTAITDPGTALQLHLVDSLAALPEVLETKPGTALDLGTGAGYPGLPLSLATGRAFVLLDSVQKKVNALAGFIEMQSITGVSIAPTRSEQLARQGARFSLVVARAVSSLPSLLELAAPLLSQGGRLVAYKGQPSADELASAAEVESIVGMKQLSTRQYELPVSGEKRTVFVYERVSKPRLPLPRREGLAQRKPLA